MAKSRSRALQRAGRHVVVALLLVATAVSAARAAAAEDQLLSPEVDADGRVTLRYRAPDANKVLVVVEGSQPAALARDETGVWSLTSDPLPPDFYSYFFVVDGLPRSDAANPLARPVVTGGHHSIVHVPGPPSLVWEVNDVPQGNVHRHVYDSAAVGEKREYFVYTPPGYEASGKRRYPVLYLLHGVTDDASAWLTAGRANVILDNLIARGQAVQMLVVLPLGYGFANPEDRLWQVVNNIPEHLGSLDVLSGQLVDEIVPRVEAEYRAAGDRESRAIAGLSMGGSQALYIGLHRLDRFAWIGSFSGALTMFVGGFDQVFGSLGAAAGDRLRLLWISCGAEDFLVGANRHYRDWLQAKGVRFIWSETAGGHTWMVFRRSLIEFAPLLFGGGEATRRTGS
jgi:enterochelin esterase family protein